MGLNAIQVYPASARLSMQFLFLNMPLIHVAPDKFLSCYSIGLMCTVRCVKAANTSWTILNPVLCPWHQLLNTLAFLHPET